MLVHIKPFTLLRKYYKLELCEIWCSQSGVAEDAGFPVCYAKLLWQ